MVVERDDRGGVRGLRGLETVVGNAANRDRGAEDMRPCIRQPRLDGRVQSGDRARLGSGGAAACGPADSARKRDGFVQHGLPRGGDGGAAPRPQPARTRGQQRRDRDGRRQPRPRATGGAVRSGRHRGAALHHHPAAFPAKGNCQADDGFARRRLQPDPHRRRTRSGDVNGPAGEPLGGCGYDARHRAHSRGGRRGVVWRQSARPARGLLRAADAGEGEPRAADRSRRRSSRRCSTWSSSTRTGTGHRMAQRRAAGAFLGDVHDEPDFRPKPSSAPAAAIAASPTSTSAPAARRSAARSAGKRKPAAGANPAAMPGRPTCGGRRLPSTGRTTCRWRRASSSSCKQIRIY